MTRPLRLFRDSLFEVTFFYKDPMGAPINLDGLVDEVAFEIMMGSTLVLSKTLTSGVTPTLETGRFDVLIPEEDIDTLEFQSADYRFRIRWIEKGWQTLGEGRVIFDD